LEGKTLLSNRHRVDEALDRPPRSENEMAQEALLFSSIMQDRL
jgi:hypothetical protein